MHPEADAAEPLRQELATMTEDPDWVRSHTLIVVSTVLLATGLWLAIRRGDWPTAVRRPLLIAAIAWTAYVVETVFHLASAVDTEALRDGAAAPVAFTHIGLALILYPVSGAAIAWLGARTFAVAELPGKAVALVAVLAGLAHAVSVPLTVLLPDAEISPLFAAAAVLLAVWSVLTSVVGFGRRTRTASTRPSAAAVPVTAS
jgi:hypothetical protein